MIQLDQVTKRFDGRVRVTALDAVSLAISAGEMVSLDVTEEVADDRRDALRLARILRRTGLVAHAHTIAR